jgi:hypothetical protein
VINGRVHSSDFPGAQSIICGMDSQGRMDQGVIFGPDD